MQYVSTRGNAPKVSAAQAIINGIAPDGGLYLPETIPSLSREEILELCGKDYPTRAAFIMKKFLDDFCSDELLAAAESAYGRFDGDPAPLVRIDEGLYMLELWHGPTLAFKDIALTMLPHLMSLSKKKLGITTQTRILVATSGDTGKAALSGFQDAEGISVIVFYPSEGVSQMQKLQMQTQEGENVAVYGVKGNFDDCQTAVKKMFADSSLAEELAAKNVCLSSANSINWGRLLPQIVYYISSYVDLIDENQIQFGEAVNFCVPTGNFGNILAGWYAGKMGLPIGRLICASNMNAVLTDFFHKGEYNAHRDFYKTMSPSMDILVSSNLERLLFELSDKDAGSVSARMAALAQEGVYKIGAEELKRFTAQFSAASATEDETIETIVAFFDEYAYPLDPHTAVAVSAVEKYRKKHEEDLQPIVVLSTASPYKFPQDVLFALTADDQKDCFRACKKLLAETAMEIPESILALKTKPRLHTRVLGVNELRAAVVNFQE